MFTGIITDIGILTSLVPEASGRAVCIRSTYELRPADIGASIACNGICLTVTTIQEDSFCVHASPETLAITTLDHWRVGDAINLERALKLGDELGGHLVQGHVDGTATIGAIEPRGADHLLRLLLPERLRHLAAPKGSITVDGISLTINAVEHATVDLMIIPHTWQHTSLHARKVGDQVNVEMDMVARYLERIASVGVRCD